MLSKIKTFFTKVWGTLVYPYLQFKADLEFVRQQKEEQEAEHRKVIARALLFAKRQELDRQRELKK